MIDLEIERKIFEKHSILLREIRDILNEDRPLLRKVGEKQYFAIGLMERYLTIFFRYDKVKKEVKIITAYPSSKIQIKSYKRGITK